MHAYLFLLYTTTTYLRLRLNFMIIQMTKERIGINIKSFYLYALSFLLPSKNCVVLLHDSAIATRYTMYTTLYVFYYNPFHFLSGKNREREAVSCSAVWERIPTYIFTISRIFFFKRKASVQNGWLTCSCKNACVSPSVFSLVFFLTYTTELCFPLLIFSYDFFSHAGLFWFFLHVMVFSRFICM